MLLKELIVPSRQALFVREIENQILSGALKLGERLPTEREMAEHMKVSKTIVHSGLSELAAKGFVDIVPRKGAFVADYVRHGKLDTLVSMLEFNGGRFDPKTLRSIVQFRLENEGTGAYLAALNRTEEDLIRLEATCDRIAKGDNSLAVSELVSDFHRDMFCATGNTIYPLVYNAFDSVIRAFTELIFRTVSPDAASNELRNVLEAIRAQDGDRARDEMTRLIARRSKELEVMYYK